MVRRAATLTGQTGGNAATTYVTGTSFAARGAIASRSFGNGVTESRTWNARLEPDGVSVANGAGPQLSLGFNYSATQNNGDVLIATIARPGFSAYQGFGYGYQADYHDGTGRLKAAGEVNTGNGNSPDWGQTYVYDKAGNRAVLAGSATLMSDYTPQSDGVTVPFNERNQWNLAAGYDGAGNMTALRTQAMVYDAEERLIRWSDSSTGRRLRSRMMATGGG